MSNLRPWRNLIEIMQKYSKHNYSIKTKMKQPKMMNYETLTYWTHIPSGLISQTTEDFHENSST